MKEIIIKNSKEQSFRLKNILQCSETLKESVRELRNLETVRLYMYNQHIISQKEHNNWLASLEKTPDKNIVFVIIDDNNSAVGVVSFTNIDPYHARSDWAFYITPEIRGGTGKAIEAFALEFVFNDLKLNKLNCEVIETNEMVIKLHEKFGFQKEGVLRDHFYKDTQFFNVIRLGITKQDYLSSISNMTD